MTARIQVTAPFFVAGVDEHLAQQGVAVMDALIDLEGHRAIADCALPVSIHARQVTVELVGRGSDGLRALINGRHRDSRRHPRRTSGDARSADPDRRRPIVRQEMRTP